MPHNRKPKLRIHLHRHLHPAHRGTRDRLPRLPETGVNLAPITDLTHILLRHMQISNPRLYRPRSPEGQDDLLVRFIYSEEPSYIPE
jgi:hypothetical protein